MRNRRAAALLIPLLLLLAVPGTSAQNLPLNPAPPEAPTKVPTEAPTETAPESAPETGLALDNQLTLTQDLKNLDFAKLAGDIWHFQVFATGGEVITVGKVLIALLVLLVGLWLAKRLAQGARRRLTKLKKIDINAAAVLSRLLYYLLALVVAFVALDIAGIPLTIFAVLGGAVAIGVGFGIQNLCNNLISSLILMVERPIRLGDIVVVGEHAGKIEDIGNRCTRLRRFDGIDVLIPNSYFLEQPVINWTLLDNDVRGKVSIGVAYGSDTQKVRQLILDATAEHTDIKNTPAPVVLFQEFGDNALTFEVWFWVTLDRPLKLKTTESDLRFRIDALCREHGVEISFPQRDVHLDTLKPLQIEMMKPTLPENA